MKTRFGAALIVALLPVGCGQPVEQYQRSLNKAMTSEEEAANKLYLEDNQDSAAEDQSTTATVDDSVKEDTKDRRLDQMVDMMLTDLDTDGSGSLSLEEFLAGPQKRAKDVKIDDEGKDRMTEKMTEDFNKFAGDDSQLSAEELKSLLKSVAPRVGRHRGGKFPGQHEKRVRQTWAEITKKYDKDGDGQLSQSEFEALEADREAERRAHDQRGPRGPGGPRGPEGQEIGDDR